VTTLIDGHNALHRLRMRTHDHEGDRRALLRRVYAIDASATVFFDARCAPPDLPSSTREEGIRVRYCRNEEADTAILRRIRESDTAAKFTVVTDDREVAGSARQLGARSRAVHAYFERPGRRSDEPERADPKGSGGFTPEDFGLPGHIDLDGPSPG
jgi:YacP-like NYN domain